MELTLDAKADDHGWTKKTGGFITTYTGRFVHLENTSPEEIDIEDIAHALSNLCRFAGHTSRFFSVAEHSIYVAALVSNPLEGLLHDASEAYLVDIPSPLKPLLRGYKEIEKNIEAAIAKKFGLPQPKSEDVKDADTAQLISEATLLIKNSREWTTAWKTAKTGYSPACLSPEKAKKAFLENFYNLTNTQKQLF